MMPKEKNYLTPEILTEIATTVESDELSRAVAALLAQPAAALNGGGEFSRKTASLLDRALVAAEPGTRRAALLHLQKEIHQLKILRLTLAVDPPPQTRALLSRWAKEHFGDGSVLSLAVDPRLLAGAVLTVGGRYFDYSLRRRLQEQWPAIREELAKELAAPAAKTQF